MEFGGIHHVTAVTANASANVAFYTQVLGMQSSYTDRFVFNLFDSVNRWIIEISHKNKYIVGFFIFIYKLD